MVALNLEMNSPWFSSSIKSPAAWIFFSLLLSSAPSLCFSSSSPFLCHSCFCSNTLLLSSSCAGQEEEEVEIGEKWWEKMREGERPKQRWLSPFSSFLLLSRSPSLPATAFFSQVVLSFFPFHVSSFPFTFSSSLPFTSLFLFFFYICFSYF